MGVRQEPWRNASLGPRWADGLAVSFRRSEVLTALDEVYEMYPIREQMQSMR